MARYSISCCTSAANTATVKRFFKRALASCPDVPRKIGTDQLHSYPAAKAEIAELANIKRFRQSQRPGNNRAENAHQPSRERERRTRAASAIPNER